MIVRRREGRDCPERCRSRDFPKGIVRTYLRFNMPDSDLPPSSDAPAVKGMGASRAVAALHLASLRRQFVAIREIFGDDPPHRAREALWVGLEVIQAELRAEPVALRDLVARAEGLLSGPTLSRVVTEMELAGLLVSELTFSERGRLKLLRPTQRALDILAARADVAFSEFASIVREAGQF